MEFDSWLDSMQDYDILEVLQGKEIQHWQKSIVDRRSWGRTLKNTLGERKPQGFEDPEGKGSQISKKPKGFGGEDPKSPREPLAAASDGVEEKNGLGF